MTEQRKARFLHRRSRTMPGTQKHAVSFGINAGWWPCLHGPFVKIEFATHRLDLWFGTPSREVPPKESRSSCREWSPFDTPCEEPKGHGPITRGSTTTSHRDRYGRRWRTKA